MAGLDECWITVENAVGVRGVVPDAYVGPDDGGGGDGDDHDDAGDGASGRLGSIASAGIPAPKFDAAAVALLAAAPE
mgnify:CR=1 FL=1